ncbi:hypothetical protein EV200_102386 [Pedobacter psychrotolerans]|uniref:Uncharacterized protein n=1 Tax=Pedobacter psychrotolerans TaxID=1843235 RepID=A0A4R2HKF7_9SPHI|nr:hypothetical protein [Pedobacter psychrotolerans]TCO28968.1 hypothetical protein EV200_102386 [Pedobacter psychrotolerans]GGE53159.1 hypothetical protein GCM10011413_19340 [Pedobacter psychrotolerans]
MKIKEWIESGIMETYVMGVATEQEIEQVISLKKQYPEFEQELAKLEYDMEMLAQGMAILPPPGILSKIQHEVNEIQLREQKVEKFTAREHTSSQDDTRKDRYIEVESESNHMRIHKAWRWVFAAVFVLGKIFLGFAIYYYLENRQAKEQIEELKMEIKKGAPLR